MKSYRYLIGLTFVLSIRVSFGSYASGPGIRVIPEPVSQQMLHGVFKFGRVTESVTNIRQAEYMTWPRAFALAESLWAPIACKNWDSFVMRVEHHFKRFDIAGINYSTSMCDAIIKAIKTPGRNKRP